MCIFMTNKFTYYKSSKIWRWIVTKNAPLYIKYCRLLTYRQKEMGRWWIEVKIIALQLTINDHSEQVVVQQEMLYIDVQQEMLYIVVQQEML